ncbi:MAG: glycosyltransferase family 4 protein [Desulforhopalus sp.]
MRILLITQLFQPEPNHLKGLAFAQELVRLGHEVEVLTGFPNYPGGKIYPNYRQCWCQREKIEGISIIRVPLYPNHSSSGFRRILCYLSLALSACIPGLFLVRHPDVVHIYQGPATLALPAIVLRLLRNVPYVLDVQDLWPESVTSSGMFPMPGLTFFINKWCDLAYYFSSKIVVLSGGYRRVLVGRGVEDSKIEVVYNWCDESQMYTMAGEKETDDPFRLAGRFTIVYAGNLGRVQALDVVLEVAYLLRQEYPDVLFVFVGDGVDADRLKGIVFKKGLNNVCFIPRQPVSEVGVILEKADALLIHLRDDPLCRVGIPQKTQAYLAAGRPIIVAVKGDAADLVVQAKAGIPCEPENPESIATAVKRLHGMSAEEREQTGYNGLAFYEQHLAFAVGVKRIEHLFKGIA